MSVSLHRLLDDLRADRVAVHFSVPHDRVAPALSYIKEISRRVQCFDIGDATAVVDFKVIPELLRLPFDYCWFEFGDGDGDLLRYAALMAHAQKEEHDHRFLVCCFGIWQGRPVTFLGNMAVEKNISGDTWIGYPMETELRPTIGPAIFNVVAKFLSALHCKNVGCIEHKPDPAHQKRRAKQGRAPLFSYRTLHLDLNQGLRERVDHGGTHSSPRLHLRRGHPRQFKPGEWTWVQPAVVGSKHGIVHKDYAVKGAQ